MKSKWAVVRDFINSKEIGTIVTRKELKAAFPDMRMGTIDTERNRLLGGGFLKYIGRGKYQFVNKIPEGMTTTELYMLYRNDRLGYLERVVARKERQKKIPLDKR